MGSSNSEGYIQFALPNTHKGLSDTCGHGNTNINTNIYTNINTNINNCINTNINTNIDTNINTNTSCVRLLINGVEKTRAPQNEITTYTQSYTAGEILRVREYFATMTANIIISLTNTNMNTCNISIQPGTS